MNNINGNNINVGYPSVQAPEVSFSLDQVKSLLHFKEAGENSRFATSAENTTGIFKLGSKGKLTNANRRRDFTCRLEDCTLDNLKIRQALFNAFREKATESDADFLENVKVTLGLDENGEANIYARKKVIGGIKNDPKNGGDGTVSLCSMPLDRRTVKQLIDQFEGRVADGRGKINTGAKISDAFAPSENKLVELDQENNIANVEESLVVQDPGAASEQFKNNLKTVLSEVIKTNPSGNNLGERLANSFVESVSNELDRCVSAFENRVKKSDIKPFEELKKLAGNIKLTFYQPFTIERHISQAGVKTWQNMLRTELIQLAGKFNCKDALHQFLRVELDWEIKEQEKVLQPSVEEPKQIHSQQTITNLRNKNKAYTKEFAQLVLTQTKNDNELLMPLNDVTFNIMPNLVKGFIGDVEKTSDIDQLTDLLGSLEKNLKNKVLDVFTGVWGKRHTVKANWLKDKDADLAMWKSWNDKINEMVDVFADELCCKDDNLRGNLEKVDNEIDERLKKFERDAAGIGE